MLVIVSMTPRTPSDCFDPGGSPHSPLMNDGESRFSFAEENEDPVRKYVKSEYYCKVFLFFPVVFSGQIKQKKILQMFSGPSGKNTTVFFATGKTNHFEITEKTLHFFPVCFFRFQKNLFKARNLWVKNS